MNRLKPKPTLSMKTFTHVKPTLGRSQRPSLKLHAESDAAPPIATFLPLHYEANYQYPLIVWLHGAAQSEQDLPQVMRHVSMRNYLAVAPRGVDTLRAAGGFHWVDSELDTSEAVERVFDAVQHAGERFSVNPERIFLAGVGAGGTMALRVALSHPQDFAGVATFDGAMPNGRRLLARVNELRDLPILLASSQHSPQYGEERLCQDLRLLHSAGAKVSVRQYLDDDQLTTVMLSDFDRWMMDIVCGAPAAV
ncbi:MAG: alpha/beta hydrolase fold domain-containing protein [Planctomycetales bacterium]|nr:alpha/beta hydrolase fold domain-containing protein [Planctomycetales bacterium]